MTQEFDSRLDKIDYQLEEIKATMAKIAIQAEQIATLQRQLDALWKKYDKMSEDMILTKNWQAGCPRGELDKMETKVENRVAFIWTALIPLYVSLFMMLYHLIKGGSP
jgi:archaellum component FlaC